MNDICWCYVDERMLTMFILDEYAGTVFEDIIPHDQPKLAAAELTLAEAGWRRVGDWEKTAKHWTAEVERLLPACCLASEVDRTIRQIPDLEKAGSIPAGSTKGGKHDGDTRAAARYSL